MIAKYITIAVSSVFIGAGLGLLIRFLKEKHNRRLPGIPMVRCPQCRREFTFYQIQTEKHILFQTFANATRGYLECPFCSQRVRAGQMIEAVYKTLGEK